MTFPQAPSERNSRTRWLKIAAAFWLLLISAVALINSASIAAFTEMPSGIQPLSIGATKANRQLNQKNGESALISPP